MALAGDAGSESAAAGAAVAEAPAGAEVAHASEAEHLPYQEATAVVEEQALEFLLTHKDPAKTTDLTASLDAGAVSPRVIREVLNHSDKFVSVNRKWDIAIRHTLGAATIDRALESILHAYGKPLPLSVLTSELAVILGRDQSYYESILPRFMAQRPSFTELGSGDWARSEWVLRLGDSDEETLFESFFMSPEEEELEALRPAAEKFKWSAADLPGSALRLVDTLDSTVSNRVLSYFAWKVKPEGFDPIAFFDTLRTRQEGLLLSGCRWCPSSVRTQFEAVYQELGQREEEAPAAEEAPVEAPVVERQLTEIGPEDLEQVYQLIAGSDRSWRVPELVETAFDLTEGDRGYEEAVNQLNQLLVRDERLLWVGTDRWREAGSVPDFVFEVPEQLTISFEQYVDESGEPIDFEMDDRGIDESLRQSLSSLLVQDFGDRDDDAEGVGEELSTFDLWVTRHHRETGTLPVLPAYRGLFPLAPEVIEMMVTTNTGQRFPVWLNETLETLFGFGRWYVEADLPISGAMFTLSRSHVPGDYRLEYTAQTEPRMVIDDERLELLEMMKLEAEGETPMPTFEILRRVVEHYGARGASFVRIWTEVNAVRRVTRRMVASLLSAYECFKPVTRGGENWTYDAGRLHLGINRQKRRYIRAIE